MDLRVSFFFSLGYGVRRMSSDVYGSNRSRRNYGNLILHTFKYFTESYVCWRFIVVFVCKSWSIGWKRPLSRVSVYQSLSYILRASLCPTDGRRMTAIAVFNKYRRDVVHRAYSVCYFIIFVINNSCFNENTSPDIGGWAAYTPLRPAFVSVPSGDLDTAVAPIKIEYAQITSKSQYDKTTIIFN